LDIWQSAGCSLHFSHAVIDKERRSLFDQYLVHNDNVIVSQFARDVKLHVTKMNKHHHFEMICSEYSKS